MRLDEVERSPTRAEIRSYVNSYMRCDKCYARVKRLSLDAHADKCLGYIQRPKKVRKFKVTSPWPRRVKPALG